jgi:pimeloyl-ACP methyl ester carboxylesterase
MTALGTIATTRQLLIGGARRLTFAEFGDPDGMPVFAFHDLPGTRLFRHPDDALTAGLGIRLITIDRPGLGLSDSQPGRGLLDWPDDVGALADALRIGSFAVLGHGAGGPYAAACAYRLPGRVTKAAIVSGLPPVSTMAFGELGRLGVVWPVLPSPLARSRWLLKIGVWLGWQGRHAQTHHQRMWARVLKACAEPDCALFDHCPELRAMMQANLDEMFRASYRGYVEDVGLVCRAWGFGLDGIRVPVAFWCGDRDAGCAVAAAQRMARAIAGSQVRMVAQAGHYVLLSHWTDILSDLRHPG